MLTRRCRSRTRSARRGFTLIELLVSIAIIGILTALLLPAVHAAREAARKTRCRYNLKQLGLAMYNHHEAHGYFPSNGWGYLWIGEPDRGSGRQQPGGWIYQLLPYLEQQPLRKLGSGQPDALRRRSLAELSRTPLAVFSCPTRSAQAVSPRNPILNPRNSLPVEFVAKTDYAVNEGDYITDTREGPTSLAEGDRPGGYAWRNVDRASGVCFQRSEIRFRDIRDGSTHTYLIGEKYVSRLHYNSFDDPGYDQSMYSGVDLDVARWVLKPPRVDDDAIDKRRFGSPHSGGAHFVFCDGRVKFISENVNPRVHRALGNRRDGIVIDGSSF